MPRKARGLGARLPRQRFSTIFIVLNNRRYAAMKRFGGILGFPADALLPGTDLPDLDFVSLAKGHGCRAERVDKADDLHGALQTALKSHGPVLLEVVVP
jgi:benzoylformate decarboxylase